MAVCRMSGIAPLPTIQSSNPPILAVEVFDDFSKNSLIKKRDLLYNLEKQKMTEN